MPAEPTDGRRARIYLTGFMGAGKTTVGEILAAARGCPFVDLDGEVQARADLPVHEIFARHGEARFRALERECLEATAAHEEVVVATGGGTVADPENRALIAALGTSVWLDAAFETVVSRLDEAAIRSRPLFRSQERARSLYNRRVDAYRRADLRIAVGADDTPREVTARVERLLRERQCAT